MKGYPDFGDAECKWTPSKEEIEKIKANDQTSDERQGMVKIQDLRGGGLVGDKSENAKFTYKPLVSVNPFENSRRRLKAIADNIRGGSETKPTAFINIKDPEKAYILPNVGQKIAPKTYTGEEVYDLVTPRLYELLDDVLGIVSASTDNDGQRAALKDLIMHLTDEMSDELAEIFGV